MWGVPTLLTEANRSAGRQATKQKGAKPSLSGGLGLPRACQECGVVLDDPSRKYCDECYVERREAVVANFATAGPAALAKRRAEGTDPAHTGEARRKQGVRAATNVRANREWEKNNRSWEPDLDYERDILSHLHCTSLSQIMKATGLSFRSSSLIGRGSKVPHPRHWLRLANLVETMRPDSTARSRPTLIERGAFLNQYEKQELIAELLNIAAQVEDRPLGRFEAGISWGLDADAFMVPEQAAWQFHSLAGRLAQRRHWSDRVSETYLRDRLVPILTIARGGVPEQVEASIDDLINEIENYSVERTAYVPLKGVLLEVPELQLGRVVFRVVDNQELDRIRQVLKTTRAAAGNADSRDDADPLPIEASKNLGGKVCALYSSVAEPTRAREQAEVEARRALEVLVYGNAALYPFHPRSDAVAGLEGEVPHLGPWIGIVGPDGFNFSIQKAPTSWPIEITPSHVEAFDRVGVFALSDLLARPEESLTDLENALLRAVHWFAASQAQVEFENRLLNLITALETLIGPDDRVRIKAIVSERTSLIVAERKQQRKGMENFVRDLYRARSEVSHGEARVVSEADVKELRWIVAELISTLIRVRDRVRTDEELETWLDQLAVSDEQVRPHPPAGAPRTLREWREERGWSQDELALRTGRPWINGGFVDFWERNLPSIADLGPLTKAIGIQLDDIALPPEHSWVIVHGHRFHLTAHPEGHGKWIARIAGWDSSDAEEWPVRAVDPEFPDIDSPSVMFPWRTTGITAARAINGLADRIVTAMERALLRERLPDESLDWQPPELPHHWKQHLEAKRQGSD
jgi:transcriptional regulator with XRE-family HTH domain